jgi:hypothetical protein
MLRFYSQYKYDDFLEMDSYLFSVLYNGMVQVLAEEHLKCMDFSMYPNADDKSRRKMHKEWYKLAYPENFESRIVKTTDLELF